LCCSLFYKKVLNHLSSKTIYSTVYIPVGLIICSFVLFSRGLFFIAFGCVFFYLQYNEFINTIRVATSFHVHSLKQSLIQMSSTITAQALHNNDTWPFVTVPAFEVLGDAARTQGGIESIAFSPLVTRENAEAWGTYSVQHAMSWLLESQQVTLGRQRRNHDDESNELIATDYVNGAIMPYIFDSPRTIEEMVRDGVLIGSQPSVENSDGPFLPFW
jgi:hypothetical protein